MWPFRELLTRLLCRFRKRLPSGRYTYKCIYWLCVRVGVDCHGYATQRLARERKRRPGSTYKEGNCNVLGVLLAWNVFSLFSLWVCVTAHNTHTPFSCRAPTILTQQLTQGALYTWSTLHRADGLLIYLLFPTHFVSSGSYRRKEPLHLHVSSHFGVIAYFPSRSLTWPVFFFSLALFVTNHFSCLNRLRNFRARDIIRFCSQLMFEQFCFFFFFYL